MTKLVLTIDDDKLAHQIIEESLAGFCKLIHAKDGSEGLRFANKYNPDIILLDIEMPGKSGYEVCQEIKQNELTKDIPVLFLSSNVDRIKGYSVGACDYIVKPFNAEELIARIKVLYEYRQQNKKLKHDIDKANKTAEIAMTESGDMGRIMRFVGQSYHANSLQQLSEFFLSFFRLFDLEIVVVFWYQHSAEFYSSQGGVYPLEQELLEQHRHSQRFVDIQNSTIINYPKVSILVKNMPIENQQQYGRYKDLFPHLLEITNEKVASMECNAVNIEHAQQVSIAFEDVAAQLKAHHNTQHTITEQLSSQLDTFIRMVNEEGGQINIADIILSLSQLEQTTQRLACANSDLAYIKYQLKHIIQSSNKLLSTINNNEQATLAAPDPQSDIELF